MGATDRPRKAGRVACGKEGRADRMTYGAEEGSVSGRWFSATEKARDIGGEEKSREHRAFARRQKALGKEKAPLQTNVLHLKNSEMKKPEKNLKKHTFCKLK